MPCVRKPISMKQLARLALTEIDGAGEYTAR